MLMKREMCFFVCFLFVAITTSAQSKIGYANPDEVFVVMKEKKQLDSMLKIFNSELQADYSSKDEDLQKLFVAFNKDSSKWNATTKAAKRILLQKKIQDLSDTQKKYEELLKAENERLMQPIQQKILKAIQDVAKENGYSIVLYSNAAADLNNGTDITDKVKKKLVF